MIRRAARRASARHGRAHTAVTADQLTLDLGAAAMPELAAVPAAGPVRGRTPESVTAMGSGTVFDATERLARAAADRREQSRSTATARGLASAEQWFELACELESESPAEAITAYHRVLELEPAMADAHVNLGRLYHQALDYAKAEAHYRAAAQYAPGEAIAWFNLGVLFEDMRRPHEAVHAYHEATEREADHADAHYNLGLLYDELGRRAEAMSHLMQARRLYSQGQQK